jgi:large subunit ribosomal protein L31
MKKDIHPEYHSDAAIKCACGNVFKLGSARKGIEVEICAACHPFFTGKEKIIDTAGRVDKFKQKMAKATILKSEKKAKEGKPKKERKGKKS